MSTSIRHALALLVFLVAFCSSEIALVRADEFSPQQLELFEKQIRPLLIERCHKCHAGNEVKGGLRLDSREAALKGGGTRNALYKLLTNVTYIGTIKYKDETHVGEHAAIVPVEVFSRVQTNLKRNGQSGGTMVRNKHSALLKGLLHCQSCGCVMTHSFSCKGNKRYRYYVCGTAIQRGWSECPAPSVSAGEIERFVVEQIRTIGKDPALLKQTTIDVQQRNHVECKRLRDEQKSLVRQMRDDHAKLQAIVANPNIASNLSGLSELQSRLEITDRRAQQITTDLAAIEAQRIDDEQIKEVLTGFDNLWQSLPPKEQVRLVRLLIESVSFDGPGGNVAITFHPTGLKSLTETQLEHA